MGLRVTKSGSPCAYGPEWNVADWWLVRSVQSTDYCATRAVIKFTCEKWAHFIPGFDWSFLKKLPQAELHKEQRYSTKCQEQQVRNQKSTCGGRAQTLIKKKHTSIIRSKPIQILQNVPGGGGVGEGVGEWGGR